jgi:type II secretory ATPase GspE/PulE/Tfp pilus assembly ATPase PilB-like protein
MDIQTNIRATKAVAVRWSSPRKTASGYTHIHKHGNGYRVRFRVDGTMKNIGTKDTIEDALRLRDWAVARYADKVAA